MTGYGASAPFFTPEVTQRGSSWQWFVGMFDYPAASTCVLQHQSGDPEMPPAPDLTPEQVVLLCRSHFAITASSRRNLWASRQLQMTPMPNRAGRLPILRLSVFVDARRSMLRAVLVELGELYSSFGHHALGSYRTAEAEAVEAGALGILSRTSSGR